jgi:hypothetical protein
MDFPEHVENLDFVLPGTAFTECNCNAVASKRSGDDDNQLGCESGSNVATALGTGLPATILYSFKAVKLPETLSDIVFSAIDT